MVSRILSTISRGDMYQHSPQTPKWLPHLRLTACLLQGRVYWANNVECQCSMPQVASEPSHCKSSEYVAPLLHCSVLSRLLTRMVQWKMYQRCPCAKWGTILLHAVGLLQGSVCRTVEQCLHRFTPKSTNNKSYKNKCWD